MNIRFQELMRYALDEANIRAIEAQIDNQQVFVPLPNSVELPDNLAEAFASFPTYQAFKKMFSSYAEANKKDLYFKILIPWRELDREVPALNRKNGQKKFSKEKLLARMAYKLYSRKKEVNTYSKAVEMVWKYRFIDPRMLELLHKRLSVELVTQLFPDEEAKEQLLKAEPVFLRMLVAKEAKTDKETVFPKFTLNAFVSFLKQVAIHTLDTTVITDEDLANYQKYNEQEKAKKVQRDSKADNQRSSCRVYVRPRQRDPRLIDCYTDAILYLWDHHSDDVTAFFPDLTPSVLHSVLSTEEQKNKLLDNETTFNREMQVNVGSISRKFSKHLLMTFLLKVGDGKIKLQ